MSNGLRAREILNILYNVALPRQFFQPSGRNAESTMQRASQLACDRSGGVSIFAKVSSKQHSFGKSATASDTPQRCFKTMRHIA